ncbi:MAG TPA: hypothetical protein VGZ32_26150 [Actinocrinis sp.]|jgi:hypothetical protein|uniref:hypothetical protein n=1 Tax=Actinocrinis sp. TaxID=1920516 RepID=UPI002DDCDBC7|nr:hypothetical protein [Actinocrinis sp.]HEV3173861.1 hypothetical protein [Actinocrinis sp.]
MNEPPNGLSARSSEPCEGSHGRAGGPRLHWEPGLGGKVTSLRFGERGREWLAPPVRPRAAPAPGQDWGDLDCSGWDECFPNIGASAEGGLADHGDVWRVPWHAPLTTYYGSAAPPDRAYRFLRYISAQNGLLRVDYRVENIGEKPLNWSWAQHMLLAADERTRIIASSPMRFRLDSAFEGGAPSTRFDWLAPEATQVAEITLDKATGRAAKLWLEPPLPAVVAVMVEGGDWLAWWVADAPFRHVGLWVNLGGWGDVPVRHVAIEPAFGAHDAPARAYSALDPLAAGRAKSWWVLVEAGRGRPALDALLSCAAHRN